METPPTTQGSGDKTTPIFTTVLSEKKRMFEDQQQGGSGVADHLTVTSKQSSKKFFGRKGGEYICMCVCPVFILPH